MIKTAILGLTFFLLTLGCKEAKKENPVKSETSIETVNHDGHAGETQEQNVSWVNEIELNDGNKWKANEETTNGVAAMLSLIKENQASTIDDYKKLGDRLNEVKNIVVKECTMTGASHDNLHVWLHPLIEKIEILQKTETTKEGAENLTGIIGHLNAFDTYFK